MNQKLRILYIRDYLRENTNEDNPVSTDQLIAYLKSNGISAERKTIYDDVRLLQAYGDDIVMQRGKNGGYFCASREFDLPEIKMLVDSVQVSKFITEAQSINLIKKLEHLTNRFEAGELHRQVVVQNRVKTVQTNIFSNIDHISNAINNDRTVSFKYFFYNMQKKPEFKNGGARYEISPFCLLWDDENYYMVGYDAAAEKMKHYRVDRMKNVSATENPRLGREIYEKIDISSYNKKVFNMYHGDEKKVKIRFDKDLMSVVLDKFGSGTMIIPDRDGEHFTITVDVVVSKQFYSWLVGLKGQCEVLEPQEARDELAAIGKALAKQYK